MIGKVNYIKSKLKKIPAFLISKHISTIQMRHNVYFRALYIVSQLTISKAWNRFLGNNGLCNLPTFFLVRVAAIGLDHCFSGPWGGLRLALKEGVKKGG